MSVLRRAGARGVQSILRRERWLLVGGGPGWLRAHVSSIRDAGDLKRRALLLATLCLVWARRNLTVFYLVRRSIPWSETGA